MLTLQYLDPWQVGTIHRQINALATAPRGYGRYEQLSNTNKRTVTATVSRIFHGTPNGTNKWKYFESFYRTHLNNGTNKFIDSYDVVGVVKTEIMQFVPNTYNYEISPSGVVTVNAEIEIFNAVSNY